MLPLVPILQGLGAVKKITSLFHKNKHHTEKANIVDKAIDTITQFTDDVSKNNPEAAKILRDHEMEMEKLYTERAVEALKVIKSEGNSEDAFVRRARPTWLYMGMIILFIQMVVFPMYGIKITEFVDTQSLNWFYSIVGAGYLGYGALRTYDKKIKNNS